MIEPKYPPELSRVIKDSALSMVSSLGLTGLSHSILDGFDATNAADRLNRLSAESAMVAFLGVTIGGSLSIIAGQRFLEQTFPAGAPRVEMGGDWLKELSNRFAGALKGHLTQYKISVRMSLPVTLATKDLLPAISSMGPVEFHAFADGEDLFVILFSGRLRYDFDLSGSEDKESIVGGPGHTVVF